MKSHNVDENAKSFIFGLFPDINTMFSDCCTGLRTLILTNNRNKVIDYMDRFDEFEFQHLGKSSIEFKLKDGMTYKWIQPHDYNRHYRCRYAIIDSDLDVDTNDDLKYLITHICFFVSKETLEVI